MKKSKTVLLAAAALAGAVVAPLAGAASNPFSNTELSSGFNLSQYAGGADGAEGKCGDPKACPEGKCGEGKCGEKCRGEQGDDAGAKTGDKQSDAAHKDAAEGKCGEGKCGSM